MPKALSEVKVAFYHSVGCMLIKMHFIFVALLSLMQWLSFIYIISFTRIEADFDDPTGKSAVTMAIDF
ncbi:hypothetical protein RSA46_16695 [Pseudomonas oryzihabitans]|nr:hypothetical protein SB5_14805 [Pseudomonas psychrotolerans]KTT43410.1 hypothetical protein RSA46_16695 [Pseudomonas psychrotolerans]